MNFGKDDWGFRVSPEGSEVIMPKKKSFSIGELILVLLAINDLWKIVLTSLQLTTIENKENK